MKASKLVEKGQYFDGCGLQEEAYAYYLEAALSGEDDGKGIFELGIKYLCGEYVDRDYEKAFKYFKMAYEMNGSLWSVYWVENEIDEIAKDKTGSRLCKEYLDYLLEQGEWDLYITIGQKYGSGKIYPRDVSKQIEYYKKAIDKDIDMGYDCLAEIYFYGKGVERDYEKAYQYLMSYEGATSYVKIFILAEMNRNGLYLEKNAEKAKELYRSIVNDDGVMKSEDMYYLQSCEILEKMESIEG